MGFSFSGDPDGQKKEGSGDGHLHREPVGVLGRGVLLPGLLRGASLSM